MAGITQATPSKTIAQVVVATPELSTLLAAATAAGLVGALSGKGPLTVFAPTNAAFKELGAAVSDRPCNVRREGGKSLVTKGRSLVILEGKACDPL